MSIKGEWSGGAVSILPGTSWAAPNGMFSTEDRNDGSAYTFTAATSTIQIPTSALPDGYILEASYEFNDTSNGRHNPQGRFIQSGGTGNFKSALAGGFNRDNSEPRSYVKTWAFVHNPSASATFQFQWKRDVDAPTGGTVQAKLTITPVYYSNYGIYSSASAALYGGTTPNLVTGFTADAESDTAAIELVANQVTLKTDNKDYIVLGGQFFEGRGGRTQRWHGLRVGGVKNDAIKAYSYYRNTSNDESGDVFTYPFRRVTTDIVIDQFCYRGDGVANLQGGADIDGSTPSVGDHALVVLELNDSAELFYSATDANSANLATTGPVDLDIAPVSAFVGDAGSFTRVSDSAINAEQAMDIMLGANVSAASNLVSATTRWTAFATFTLNGVELPLTMAGDYLRNNQSSTDTFGWSANLISSLAVALGDDIGLSVTELVGSEGGGGNILSPAGWTGIWAINTDSMPVAGGGDVIEDIDSGSFTLTGSAIGSLYHHQVQIESGSYSISGQAVATFRSLVSEIESGSFTLTGNAVTTGISESIILSASPNIAASGEATTAQLIAPAGKTSGADFEAGRIQDDENPADSSNLGADKYTEYEWALEFTPPAIPSSIHELRITINGVPLDTYTIYPEITVADGVTTAAIVSGAYNLTGSAVGSLYHHRSAIDSGSYSINGAAVASLKISKALIDAGAFNLTGSEIGNLHHHRAQIASDGFLISPAPIETSYHRRTGIDAGAYTITGSAVDTAKTFKSQIESGSYTITGSAVGSLHHQRTAIDSGSFTLTGSDVGSLHHHRAAVDPGAYTITGGTVDTIRSYRAAIDAGAFSFTGSAIDSLHHHRTAIDAGAYTLTGASVDTLQQFTSPIDAGAFVISGSDIETFHHRLAVADSGSFVITGAVVDTIHNSTDPVAQIDPGVFTISGAAIDSLYQHRAAINAGAFNLTGTDVGSFKQSLAMIESGLFNLNGSDIDTLHHYLGAIAAGSYAITPAPVSTALNLLINIESGTFLLTGANVESIYQRLSVIESGAFVIDGSNISTFVSGGPLPYVIPIPGATRTKAIIEAQRNPIALKGKRISTALDATRTNEPLQAHRGDISLDATKPEH